MQRLPPHRAASTPHRILHIGKFHPPYRGGMETYLADLLRQQRASGMDARALVHGTPLPDDPPWLTRLKVQIHMIFTPIALGFPWAIVRHLRSFRPDVLHLHMPNVAVFWLLLIPAARRVPWVVHWHSDVVVSDQQRTLALAYRLYRPFETGILAQARYVIATSPPYLQASATLRPWRDKCVAIPLGLHEPDGHNNPETIDNPAATAPLPWKTGHLRVLSIGRLTYYKGFETLIRAVCGMEQVQLLIVGGGDLQPRLQTLIDELQPHTGPAAPVQLLGNMTEAQKFALLESCEVFALASLERTEAFGLALVEAMQFGKPCVVSDLPGSGMPWLIRQSGAGLCIPLGDIQAWRMGLQHLQQHPKLRHTLGLAGQQAARRLFSIDSSSLQVHSLYRAMLPENRQASQQRLLVVPLHQPLEANALHKALDWLRTLQQWGDVVLVNEVDNAPAFQALLKRQAAQAGMVVIHLPGEGDSLHIIQTGVRWALRGGYQQCLQLPAGTLACASKRASLPTALEQLMAASHDAVDWLVGVPAHQAPYRPTATTRWIQRLTGLCPHTHLAHSLQLCHRAAMVQLLHAPASMLDVPELGIPVLMRQAGLRAQTIRLPSLDRPPAAAAPKAAHLLRRSRFLLEATVMYLATWRGRPSDDSRSG